MCRLKHRILLAALALTMNLAALAEPVNSASLSDRILIFTEQMNDAPEIHYTKNQISNIKSHGNIQIEQCNQYPYHNQSIELQGYLTFLNDLKLGLKQGLQCLSGHSTRGPLHPFHEKQAMSLLDLFESSLPKYFRCVEDQTYAYAIARLPPDNKSASKQFDTVAADVAFPAVVVDTYRISGFISRKHKPVVYRDFFKLDDRQIERHLNEKPQQFAGMHRYKNRASLLFHEVTHWLGFTHGNTYPDVVQLYETCCFGGSDFIQDKHLNQTFQDQACAILKDKELWEANPYQQMRLWKFKGYDLLKTRIREAYN